MEVEVKYRIPDLEFFNKLKKVKPPGDYFFGEQNEEYVQDTYLDTYQHEIASAGFAFRLRKKEDAVLLTLKSLQKSEGHIHSREEIETEVPEFSGLQSIPDSDLKENLLAMIKNHDLLPLFQFDQHRIVRPIYRGQEHLADCFIDSIIMTSDKKKVNLYQCEVELEEPHKKEELEPFQTWCEDYLHLPPESRSKFEIAMDFFGLSAELSPYVLEPDQAGKTKNMLGADVLRSIPPKKVSMPVKGPQKTEGEQARKKPKSKRKKLAEETRIELDDHINEAIRKILLFQFKEMTRNEKGTLKDEKPKYLHDMRVACRRMRTALDIFSDHLEKKIIEDFRDYLRTNTRVLGRVRDLQVFQKNYAKYREKMDPSDQDDFRAFESLLEKKIGTEKEKLFSYLKANTYNNHKKRYEVELGSNKLNWFCSPNPAGIVVLSTVRHLIPELLVKEFSSGRAFNEYVNAGSMNIERYHELRILFKKLRYTMEFFVDCLDNHAPNLIKKIIQMQNYLGEMQDSVVASEILSSYLNHGDWGKKAKGKVKTAVLAPGISRYLTVLQEHIRDTIKGFPRKWKTFMSPTFSEQFYTMLTDI